MSNTSVRFTKIQLELDDAEERADMAETTVTKLRLRTREPRGAPVLVGPVRSGPRFTSDYYLLTESFVFLQMSD